MIIECLSMRAVGQVLVTLLNAQLRPRHEFTAASDTQPITFTLTATPSIEQLSQLRAAISTVTETRILDKRTV